MVGWLKQVVRSSPAYGPLVRTRYRISSRRRADLFSRYYRENVFGDPESRSGFGSSWAATAAVRRELPRIVRTYGISTILDIPCGDWAWMQHVEPGLELAGYCGAEVVPELVEALRVEHARPGRTFVVADAVFGTLPAAELILSRDLLIHLPNSYGVRALGNFCSAGATWLLSTTYPTVDHNEDVHLGGFRPVNLCLPPFNLHKPIELFKEMDDDNPRGQGKSMGLWRLPGLVGSPGPRWPPPSPGRPRWWTW